MERSTWNERVTEMRGRSQKSTRVRGVALLMLVALLTLNVAAGATEPISLSGKWQSAGSDVDIYIMQIDEVVILNWTQDRATWDHAAGIIAGNVLKMTFGDPFRRRRPPPADEMDRFLGHGGLPDTYAVRRNAKSLKIRPRRTLPHAEGVSRGEPGLGGRDSRGRRSR